VEDLCKNAMTNDTTIVSAGQINCCTLTRFSQGHTRKQDKIFSWTYKKTNKLQRRHNKSNTVQGLKNKDTEDRKYIQNGNARKLDNKVVQMTNNDMLHSA